MGPSSLMLLWTKVETSKIYLLRKDMSIGINELIVSTNSLFDTVLLYPFLSDGMYSTHLC